MPSARFHKPIDPPSVRIPGIDRPVRLRTATGNGPEEERLFTLHSAKALRLENGELELEQIAGFCHERNMLRTYRMGQIMKLYDVSDDMEIADLAAWLKTRHFV